jgi:hypothetical protein
MDQEYLKGWWIEAFRAMPKWAQLLGLRPVCFGPERREVDAWIAQHLDCFNAMLMTPGEIADEVARVIGYFLLAREVQYSPHFIQQCNLRGIPEIGRKAIETTAKELREAWQAENAVALREWHERKHKAYVRTDSAS